MTAVPAPAVVAPWDLPSLELTPREFEWIRRTLATRCGIALAAGKEGLVKTRLAKRLRALGLTSFAAYLHYVATDTSGQELARMIDALTTNKTGFFREPGHFAFVQRSLLPRLRGRRGPVRFWSAGCASGEEPYSLAMAILEVVPDAEQRPIRILATDISTRVLAMARAGRYDEAALHEVPALLRQRYFTCVQPRPPRVYEVRPEVRALVRLARLNLVDPWPMRGPFAAIFCRNVMIYFDRATRAWLVDRFWELLEPGGCLLVGHSESLTGLPHRFRYVQPSVYAR